MLQIANNEPIIKKWTYIPKLIFLDSKNYLPLFIAGITHIYNTIDYLLIVAFHYVQFSVNIQLYSTGVFCTKHLYRSFEAVF